MTKKKKERRWWLVVIEHISEIIELTRRKKTRKNTVPTAQKGKLQERDEVFSPQDAGGRAGGRTSGRAAVIVNMTQGFKLSYDIFY